MSFSMRGHGPLDFYHWPLIGVIKEKKRGGKGELEKCWFMDTHLKPRKDSFCENKKNVKNWFLFINLFFFLPAFCKSC